MSERKEELYSSKLPAGNRTYFFDVKEAVNSKRYLTITESKRIHDSEFERHSVIIFAEDALAFNEEIGKAIRWMFDSPVAGPAADAVADQPVDWTEDDEQALRHEFVRLGEHCTIEQLATLLQRRPSDIRSKLEEMGLL
jgi:hypothetical protein